MAVAGVFGLFQGVQARYAPRANVCAGLDMTDFAQLLGGAEAAVSPVSAKQKCLISIKPSTLDSPYADGDVTVSYLSSTVEALLSYEFQVGSAAVDVDATGDRAGLSITDASLSRPYCSLYLLAQSSNILVTATLGVSPRDHDQFCVSTGQGPARLAAALRTMIAQLAVR